MASIPKKDQHCGNCDYAMDNSGKKEERIECHRWPPEQPGWLTRGFLFVGVMLHNWCGEWHGPVDELPRVADRVRAMYPEEFK